MTEGRALLAAAAAHVVLLLALSFGLARTLPPLRTEPDVTPVDFVEIGPEPTATTPPKPSMAAAPREAGPPPPAEPQPAAAAPLPEPRPADAAPQDALAEAPPPKPKPEKNPPPPAKEQPKPAKPASPAKPRDDFDAGQMAALIDKSLPAAPTRPRDVSTFARSIESAIPKGARISPRQVATLEQAIRAQIAPCWNPPLGGADVQGMTVVLRIRLNRDGTVDGQPQFVSQTGATAGNQAYARAFVETARRAVLRCAPLQLPADLYSYWQEFELNFDPRLMT
jgi:outer membrane biosynthesis protein TonB